MKVYGFVGTERYTETEAFYTTLNKVFTSTKAAEDWFTAQGGHINRYRWRGYDFADYSMPQDADGEYWQSYDLIAFDLEE